MRPLTTRQLQQAAKARKDSRPHRAEALLGNLSEDRVGLDWHGKPFLVDYDTMDIYMKANNLMDNLMVAKFLQLRGRVTGEPATKEERIEILTDARSEEVYERLHDWIAGRKQRAEDPALRGAKVKDTPFQDSLGQRRRNQQHSLHPEKVDPARLTPSMIAEQLEVEQLSITASVRRPRGW